ncbi:hypothetical protein CFR75_11145 [Komagataeibacter xylinus]|uniref:Uncharacterized protein n=1 Tax=Komagataeibacter xylinus TaxID=28448 RepID=A0A318PJQ1_KOMXY|nr:hypothetical protein [Komagataeibacter xylinus]PYD56368.1 hypothetical protein CFR75_11145 [Komagataeibacter xylinus]GBQ74911.1 hypothetical protein AA15237_2001 [Komagataeibacter xylinus NBRC 15237]
MSNAATTMTAALVSAQEKKASGKAKAAQKAPAARRFEEAARRAPVITIEAAEALIPVPDQISKIVSHFGLDDFDADGLAETTRQAFTAMARSLSPVLVVTTWNGEENDKGLEMHLQRMVGAAVSSAYGAAQFYDNKRAQARELSSQFNEYREEDRQGVDGLENKAANARRFAAEQGMKAAALVASARGALAAYEDIIGTPWKPYVAGNARALNQQAAAAEMDALGF